MYICVLLTLRSQLNNVKVHNSHLKADIINLRELIWTVQGMTY